MDKIVEIGIDYFNEGVEKPFVDDKKANDLLKDINKNYVFMPLDEKYSNNRMK